MVCCRAVGSKPGVWEALGVTQYHDSRTENIGGGSSHDSDRGLGAFGEAHAKRRRTPGDQTV